ncbi:MAG: hypothetical protein L6R42_005777 [Xanthoria sp. 1 TBL-2021]|nr:MAG: hypothetical protein L6R42_005777 [Xanthoria sp. 1 TBL-2021]
MPKEKVVFVPPKKLTLSQLASYDDILTDALVDHVRPQLVSASKEGPANLTQVYFWTTIRKNRSKYNIARGISEDDVTNILLHQVIVEKDVQKAEASLLQLPGLRKFHSALKSDREKEDFRRHMRKYISIWLPDCPFEVSTTNRYTIITHEAAVTARREIKKGETVKYLVGNLVAMTPEEEKDLGLTRRDFSIVMSSRKRTPSIFLGPARFANHDCKANARLVTCGSEGMQIVAAREIGIGEEITVTYGDNYFGEGNCECLCRTCEETGCGAWSGPATHGLETPPLTDEVEVSGLYALRTSTRKRSRVSEMSETQSSTLENQSPRTSRKSKASETQSTSVAEPSGGLRRSGKKRTRMEEESLSTGSEAGEKFSSKRLKSLASQARSPRRIQNHEKRVPGSLKVEYKAPALSLSELQGNNQHSARGSSTSISPMADAIFDELSAALKRKPSKAKGVTKLKIPRDSENTAEGMVDDDKRLELVAPTVPSTPNGLGGSMRGRSQPTDTPTSSSDQDFLFDSSKPPVSSPATTPSEDIPGLKSTMASERGMGDSDEELSELDPEVELDDSTMTIVEKTPRCEKAAKSSKILPTIEVEDASLRVPGDYTRTALLLGEKYSRWVDCRTCSGCWVQPNGYQTRKECPRCERHSKLYGYQWPKTDRQGKDDEEERVMDHRTVHRFINFQEERLLVKRGKGVNRARSKSSGATSRTDSLPADVDHGPLSRLRGSRRSWRGSQLKCKD